MSKIIDFVKYNGWGHAFHGGTWSEIKDPRPIWKRFRQSKFVSVIVHSSHYPKKGNYVRYKSSNGNSIARIFDYKPCMDPADMFTLTLQFDKETSQMTLEERSQQ